METFVKLHHLCESKHDKKTRQGSKYVTVAQVVNKATGEVLGQGISRCRKEDPINKPLGNAIATSRAYKKAFEGRNA